MYQCRVELTQSAARLALCATRRNFAAHPDKPRFARCRFVISPYLGHCKREAAVAGWRPFANTRAPKVIFEIVILAMIAAFLGLRLYSVLGRRAEHEEEPIPTRFDPPEEQLRDAAPSAVAIATRQQPVDLSGVAPGVEQGLRAIAASDRSFDIISFLDGAKSAYGIILEAFWNGDRQTLRELCDDDVYASFDAAICAREDAGETLDNALIRIEEAKIDSARLDGRQAQIGVLFVADIAAVTRDKEGTVIAGSLDDAIESRDIWTFSRNVDAANPNWVLDETDEG